MNPVAVKSLELRASLPALPCKGEGLASLEWLREELRVGTLTITLILTITLTLTLTLTLTILDGIVLILSEQSEWESP